ncbi:hypothetical protein Bca4012_094028 [Brassica carinata]|uniref:Uncharacterized protein n=5 Tax=Brassica TaxID=3705 RepID=A0A8S9MNG7_BRACR|nr:hypothetical protein F2Q68_00040735 [Brassica cretica]KAG2238439.1 hypothetical protein Bca52824_092319 [Brassica carinata]KAH0863910.1 hypothetical protein HID58_081121 [Brassica napus]VDD55988.1 unnamed protein product [Brassica oleracea]KAF3497341.1 hypothetical protein DY000_02054845 [Brassica cretica]
MSSSGGSTWKDNMITRYYDALRQVQFDQGKIKRIAEIMNIPKSEVQRESNKLNKVAKKNKKKG